MAFDNLPIYRKIYDDIKEQISKGILKSDEKLPSVRELALQMMVNPNTIQKAYAELESDGYIYTVRGKGNFVCSNTECVKNNIYKSKIENISKLVEALIEIGFDKKKILKDIQECIK